MATKAPTISLYVADERPSFEPSDAADRLEVRVPPGSELLSMVGMCPDWRRFLFVPSRRPGIREPMGAVQVYLNATEAEDGFRIDGLTTVTQRRAEEERELREAARTMLQEGHKPEAVAKRTGLPLHSVRLLESRPAGLGRGNRPGIVP